MRMSAPAWARLVLTIGLSTPAFSLDPDRSLTQYVHRIWQTQPGLRQSSIYTVTQSHDGYIWLGTQSGAVRFDGVEFTPVPSLAKNSLEDLWVLHLEEDSTGRMWMIDGDRRLVRADADQAGIVTTKDGLSSNEASCLAAARDGGVWACSPGGLTHLEGDRINVFPAPAGMIKTRQNVACQTPGGTVWMGGQGAQLISWTGSASYSTLNLTSVPPSTTIRSLLCGDTELWVGTTDGLVRVANGGEQIYVPRDGLPDRVIVTLEEDNSGALWIGTRRGFSRFRDGEFANYAYSDGLSQSTVYSIFQDREGSMWVATKNGLNQFSDGAAIPYTTNQGLPSNNMGPVIEDRQGHIWGGTLDAGLFRFDRRHFTSIAKAQNLASNRVSALVEDRDGDIWVGTVAGLNRLQNGRVVDTYTTSNGLPSDIIRSLFMDHSGALWAGTAGGPARLQEGRFVQAPGTASLRAPISAIGETRDGRMIFAADHGAVYLLGKGELAQIAPGQAEVRDVDAIYLDTTGLVWMGTYGNGLILWREGRTTAITMRDGLSDGQIFGIVQDGPDRLWMACSKGFFSVSRANLLAFEAGKVKKVASVPYSPLYRMGTVESQPGVQPSVWRDHKGQLWFSTIRGLLAFEPDRRSKDAPPPPVVIDEISVNGADLNAPDLARLTPGPKSITFGYTALSFLQPEQMTFRYKLDGYDKDWIDAGTRREAFYSNLPPGSYRFVVTACGPGVTCNQAGTSVDFGLAPQLYQQVWFFPLCGIITALVGWFLYQVRIQQLRDQLSLISGERNRIARELHDTLIQGFSGITMQMQALAARVRSGEERETLEEIIRDAGHCLRETRQSVAGLRASGGGGSLLAAAVAETARQLTEETNVRLKLKLDQKPMDLAAEVKYNLLRITQEAIANSVKHSSARGIEIMLSRNTAEVCLSIRDDGRGFVRNGDLAGDTGHYGIIGMRERASQMGADLKIASILGRGTTVTIRVPVKPATRTAVHENQEAVR